ncbi:LIM domain only protein 7 isoform X4 [Clinocottus analis]|uniref:LIM domain only protein 7 isoform X4 n=1 Tax=Clinocottus analis TaxID=304258 RepID=UPI0035C0AC82
MEWRERSAVSCDEAYEEAQRWIEAVTNKKFGSEDFRSALENGVLLCDLINKITPGVIRRVNRLPTPIAGLDNLNVFLKACRKLGLKEAQLFHPGDLQDLSTRVTVKHQETNRRLKNVLITIYWLGRRAQCDRFYDGPNLNLKAFEGLLGTALYKALQESSGQKGSNVRDSGFGDSWCSEREELFQLREEGGGRGGHRRDDSLDSLDSLSSRSQSISSDTTLKGSTEGCCSDTEADSVFRMAENKSSLSYRRSVTLTPKATSQFNQFLPSKDKPTTYVPAPLRKKRAERNEESRRSWANPMYTENEAMLTRLSSDRRGSGPASPSASPVAHLQWAYEYESGSDSDAERPDPDLVLDDLASRRFHSPSPAPPANFAVPASPLAAGRAAGGSGAPWPKFTMTPNVAPQQNVTCLSSSNSGGVRPPEQGSVRVDHRQPVSTDSLFREIYDDSEDDDDDVGYADPVQDDLYSRKMGVKPQPVAKVSYDKFLPKFWTPEEDTHIQKIKLGSQRRPWYKKIQGFSYKKSGSSSDDSDCDVSPWLSSARSPSGPPPPHTRTHEASAHATLVVGKSPHIQAHTLPQLPEIQPPLLVTPPLRFAPVDPASGPRLVKCERWPLLGRQDPREPPDPFDYESISPDLENDDMFTRRTLAFQSNTDLAMMKTRLSAHRRPYSSEPQLNIVTQRHGGYGAAAADNETNYPDIEQDDVVYRKEKTQQAQHLRPLSGAPDHYAPMAIPEPWALPPDLKARLLCPPCPLTQEAAAHEQNRDGKEALPKTDDMLVRKLCAEPSSQGEASAIQMTPSAPPSCSEGDLQRWQEIREASRLRYKKRLMVERLAQQAQESIGGKSTSDIQVDSSINRQARYEELQKYREQTKETDDKWQDDLSKWKSRRKSVNSDIVKKKEEREKIELSTSGSRRSKTFKEMQEERENKGKNSIGGRLGSLSYLDNEDVFDEPVVTPRTRTLPARSYTIDTPYYSSGSPEPPLKEDEPPAASPATGRAASPPTSQGTDTLDSPAGRDTAATTTTTTTTPTPTSRNFFHRSQSLAPAAAAAAPLQSPVLERSSTVKSVESAAAVSSSRSLRKLPEVRPPLLRAQTEAGAPSSGSLYKQQPHLGSMEPKPPGASRVSASLPRSYQRPDSARLTSIVAPRPFGTQSSRLTSLPRALTVDDPQKRVNGDGDTSKKSTVPSRYHQFMTSEDELQSQSSSAHSSEDEEEEEEEDKTTTNSVTSIQSISSTQTISYPQSISSPQSVSSTQSVSPVHPQVKTRAPVSPAPAKETSQENFCELRISLNQKPNSSRDFGFQTAWDSTGAHVASIQPGSPAEMCQLQAGDEVLTVNGHQVAEMSYSDWKSSMDEALQEGSLIMDIRHHGRNNWDRDQPPMPFKSHKTINLTSMDHPILLGFPDISSSLDLTSRASMEKPAPKEAPAHTVLDVASNGVNGGFREPAVTLRNKESEPMSLKNLKRRSEFFEKGGSESAMPDIPVPSITPSSSRWSWDPEEERRRQEKWQKEQERLLQEKYKRDQEKLQEEWLKDQEEVAKSVGQQEPGILEVIRGTGGSLSPLSPVDQPTTPSWEEQERKEKEEQERKWKEEQEHQRQAEERRKREEEERELRRLQEQREMRDRQQRQEEEMKRREEEELRWQKRKEEERAEERRRQEAAELQRRERERALAEQQRQQQQQQWAAGFANVPPSLSFTDRTKSQSSPQLDEEEKPQRKVTGVVAAEKKGPQSASQAEQERQQILNEMKKKTPLLTDKSWIRQRSSTTSAATTKESDVPPMRRGESLDNLDSSYNSWRSSWTGRNNSHTQSYAQSYSRPNSALSGSAAFYGGGWSGAQRPASSAPRPASSTLPSSYSMGSLWTGAGTPSSPWSRQSPSPSPSSPSPTTSPEPTSEGGPPQQRSRSVSGRKVCTFCDTPLGKGAAMIIESLGLCYHLSCFKCIDCKSDLGGSAAGAEVRIRSKQLYCNTCYTRFKAGQPTTM